MRITLIHPCIGRRPGQTYIRTWQMEPLPAATLAGLTPRDVDVRFYDDRMEVIPFDEPTDLVALSVETYTAKRAYQIASEYRRRKVPVVMGGFHASLCPDEVARHAESVVTGEAELTWPLVVDDARHGRLQKRYRQETRPSLAGLRPDRSIFRGKRYTYKWLSLFIQFYLLEGALRATSDVGMSQWLAMAETLLAAIIFVTTILYIRATRAPQTEKSAQPS